MITRIALRSLRSIAPSSTCTRSLLCQRCAKQPNSHAATAYYRRRKTPSTISAFHTTAFQYAQGPSADALMESLNDLYATAKDEFEIAAEETEKNTTYAQDDRQAAREALTALKEFFNRAVKESDPEVAKEVTSRVGQRIRELENAVTAMEESAIEH